MPDPVVQMTQDRSPLSVREAKRLEELEAIVAEHADGFFRVGMALAEIREKRLYRTTHRTFEAYSRAVFELSRPRAYQLIDGASVVENILRLSGPGADEESSLGEQLLAARAAKATGKSPDKANSVYNCRQIPIKESHARVLSRLETPEDQLQAWNHACSMAEETKRGKVTARHVGRAVDFLLDVEVTKHISRARQAVCKASITSESFNEAFQGFLDEIMRARDAHWKETPKEAVLKALDALKDAVNAG